MKKAFKNSPSLGRGLRGEGFTLAEVLITLMIIGIVAALTIPSVISNYQQQEFKTGLKKAVSVLNEAIQTNIAQDGETPYENRDLFNYLQKHMSIIKSDEKGYGRDRNLHNSVFYTTDGMRFEFPDDSSWSGIENNKYVLHETGIPANGRKSGYTCDDWFASIYGCHGESKLNGYCGAYGLSNNPNNTKNTPCVINVDVNGDKKPNLLVLYGANVYEDNRPASRYAHTYAKPSDKKLSDIFTIMITDEKAIPFGVVAQRAMYSK